MTAEDVINDVLVELGKLPDHLLIATVFDNKPAELKALANEWGWMDTEVREQLYAIAWRIVNAQP
ncbi:hypothetical protein M4D07_23745 [Klebsiella pneumoniae]|jgi:hypothetical protein|uniref:Uncharacterized protein n=1 Tax=Klebsiella pneumoniae TaxID=573 RepID=A0A9Q4WUK1_KLEPN|nr:MULTISPECIES: hypothetical protein [Klebsiella]ELY2747247.1 hypothetical protein [Cronobacter sakazakii]WGZ96593.1 hypothetical protein QJQ59_00035 [Klebsiella michiganensis]HBQ3012227.1 hypothetical protein [Klebsiella quasipneumoniae subsp. similipneumoniae]EIW8602420.1 hypothetical protein [Klebsiella pneumoniae]EKW2698022.1 hypothetical protein [Klebsiella pneumoniae]